MAEGLSNAANDVGDMKSEWNRLATYSNYDSSLPVSAIVLAKEGFYRIGIEKVECFACGVVEKNWSAFQNVSETHRRISPRCRYINRHDNDNVPIHKRFENDTESDSCNGSTSSRSTVYKTGSSSLTSDLPYPISDSAPPVSDNRSNYTESGRSLDSGQASGGSSDNGQSTGTSSSLSGLGLNFKKPKYPQYATLSSRIKTYDKWPKHLSQTAEEMSRAGFVCAGHQDYTRCFFCGGGLRNWEPGDNPWVEHARWFPKCAFVHQNKGEKWVHGVLQACKDQVMKVGKDAKDIVLKSASEEMPSGESESSTSSDDIWDIPAVKSVEEIFKYSRSIITQAVDAIKGRKDLKSVTAAELVEAIFDIEDGNLDSGLSSLTTSENTTGTSENNNTSMRESSESPLPSSENSCTATTSSNITLLRGSPTGSLSVSEDTSSVPSDNTALRRSPGSPIPDERRQLLQENEELRNEQICTICREKEVSIVFLPCGHYITCMDCAPAVRRCPACHLLIQGTIKAWLV